ncbi:hypothetical protein [Jiulongibacter sp. NS-SX5]|uniref:hypothetical protein n=1 Tax=Jiulongibacter sp. NS-SX5 TaxID=3463854 RepID=UPI0040597696
MRFNINPYGYFKTLIVLLAVLMLSCTDLKFDNFKVLYRKDSGQCVTLVVANDGIKKWEYSYANNSISTEKFSFYSLDKELRVKLKKVSDYINSQSEKRGLGLKDVNDNLSFVLIKENKVKFWSVPGIYSVTNKDL